MVSKGTSSTGLTVEASTIYGKQSTFETTTVAEYAIKIDGRAISKSEATTIKTITEASILSWQRTTSATLNPISAVTTYSIDDDD